MITPAITPAKALEIGEKQLEQALQIVKMGIVPRRELMTYWH